MCRNFCLWNRGLLNSVFFKVVKYRLFVERFVFFFVRGSRFFLEWVGLGRFVGCFYFVFLCGILFIGL